jgi:hypothetical protein
MCTVLAFVGNIRIRERLSGRNELGAATFVGWSAYLSNLEVPGGVTVTLNCLPRDGSEAYSGRGRMPTDVRFEHVMKVRHILSDQDS